MSDLGLNSLLIHADDSLARVIDIASPIDVSTTYKYPDDPNDLVPACDKKDFSDRFIYSRFSHPNTERVEKVLEAVFGEGSHVIAYSSGLSSFYAAMTYFSPKTVAIGDGYHGCHGILNILTKNYGLKQIPLDAPEEELQPGDIVHLETPVNPTGISFDIQHYADKAHRRGAYLLVDATFAPPPLQDPFLFGADMVMHSATKYFGGHSDLLAGILVTKDLSIKKKLFEQRLLLGTITGNLESHFLLRSLRTFEIRIKTQSSNATQVVSYLKNNVKKLPIIDEIYHSSLQTEEFVKKQLPIGYGPVFSIKLKSKKAAKHLPSKLRLFHHATSLGGVESLVEWRAMSDPTVEHDLLRFSVGIENVEDLIKDLTNALEQVGKEFL